MGRSGTEILIVDLSAVMCGFTTTGLGLNLFCLATEAHYQHRFLTSKLADSLGQGFYESFFGVNDLYDDRVLRLAAVVSNRLMQLS